MARKFSELTRGMSKERRERIRKLKLEMEQEDFAYRRLQEIRQALAMTQVELAKQLQVNQSAVSKLESQTDMYISTLRRIISALGGELQIQARFPGDIVFEIDQFASSSD